MRIIAAMQCPAGYFNGVYRAPATAVPRASREGDDAIGGGSGRSSTGITTRARSKTKKPSMYKVLMLNDDYTPMEFVVMVLERFFSKPHEEAIKIMLHVDRKSTRLNSSH